MVPYLYTLFAIYVFMIIQKAKAYEYKGKTKYKYTIVVPEKDMEKLGWDKGTKLEGTIVKDNGYFLTLKKSK